MSESLTGAKLFLVKLSPFEGENPSTKVNNKKDRFLEPIV